MEAESAGLPRRLSRYNNLFERAKGQAHIGTFSSLIEKEVPDLEMAYQKEVADLKKERADRAQEQERNNVMAERRIQNEIRREAGPSLTTMAGNFIGAMGAYAKDGFRNVSKEEHAVRQAICNGCEFWDARARMGEVYEVRMLRSQALDGIFRMSD